MNTSIQELVVLLNENEVTNINDGLLCVTSYFDGFEFHELKDEWLNMNKKDKREFIKTLMNTEPTEEVTESDIDDGLIEVTDEQESQEELTDLQKLVQEELNELNIRKVELMNELNGINTRIFELTGQSTSNESKMDKARRVYELNPGLSRKDMLIKFQTECELTKSGSATYYNTIKSSKK
jgi:hypothetical protein